MKKTVLQNALEHAISGREEETIRYGGYVYIYIYTGASQKNRISWKKLIFFRNLIQKVKLSYIIDSLRVK